MTDAAKSPGEVAYEAFNDGKKGLVPDLFIFPWWSCGGKYRESWEAVADAVRAPLIADLASRDQRIAELEAELQAIYESENPIDLNAPPFVKGQLVRLHPVRNRDDAAKLGLEIGRTYEVYEVDEVDFCGSKWRVETDAPCGPVDSAWFIKVI